MVYAEGEVHNTVAVVGIGIGIGIGMARGEAPVRPASAGIVAGFHVHGRSPSGHERGSGEQDGAGSHIGLATRSRRARRGSRHGLRIETRRDPGDGGGEEGGGRGGRRRQQQWGRRN